MTLPQQSGRTGPVKATVAATVAAALALVAGGCDGLWRAAADAAGVADGPRPSGAAGAAGAAAGPDGARRAPDGVVQVPAGAPLPPVAYPIAAGPWRRVPHPAQAARALGLQALAQACRQGGGRWQAAWVACVARDAGGGGAALWPVDPSCRPSCTPTCAPPCGPIRACDAAATWPLRCTAHVTDGRHTWHRGATGPAARAWHDAVRASHCDVPEAGVAHGPPGGLRQVHVDVATLQRHWPTRDLLARLPVAADDVALVLWAAPQPRPQRRLARGLRRVLRHVARQPPGGDACPWLPAATQRRLVAGIVHFCGPARLRRRPARALRLTDLTTELRPGPPGPQAWRRRASLPTSRLGRAATWQVVGVNAQVLLRRLRVRLGPAGGWQLDVHVGSAGEPLGFRAATDARLLWYDAGGNVRHAAAAERGAEQNPKRRAAGAP